MNNNMITKKKLIKNMNTKITGKMITNEKKMNVHNNNRKKKKKMKNKNKRKITNTMMHTNN